MTTFTPEEMAHATAVLNNVRDNWLAREGVTAVDLGFKWSQGLMTGKLSIRVHVAQKRPLAELTESELFPKEIEGIPVDIIEAQYGLQLLPDSSQLEAAPEARKSRYDPIPLGVSAGNSRITAGTLGAKVYDAATLQPMALSNWHVFAGSPAAAVGEPIWQPGALDGGNSGDTFATLSRFLLGPYDAAVAQLTGSRDVMSETLDGDVIEDAAAPQLGMFVWKSGRTTERTQGFIDGIKMTTSINYGAAGVRAIQDVVRIVPRPGAGNVEISMGGDSGSVWVAEDSGKAVGLHFAGEVGNAPEHALATELQPVLDRLNVLMPAQRPSPPPPDPITDPVDPPPTPPPSDDTFPPPPQPTLFQRLWQSVRSFWQNLFK
jgi:endonuclease G